MFEVLGTYLTIIEFCLMVLSPAVLAALISGFHAFGSRRRPDLPVRPTITRAAPAAA
jgi:hypothetical protein